MSEIYWILAAIFVAFIFPGMALAIGRSRTLPDPAPIISGIDLHVYDECKLNSPGGFGVKYEGKAPTGLKYDPLIMPPPDEMEQLKRELRMFCEFIHAGQITAANVLAQQISDREGW